SSSSGGHFAKRIDGGGVLGRPLWGDWLRSSMIPRFWRWDAHDTRMASSVGAFSTAASPRSTLCRATRRPCCGAAPVAMGGDPPYPFPAPAALAPTDAVNAGHGGNSRATRHAPRTRQRRRPNLL